MIAFSYLSSMAGFWLSTQQVMMEIHQRKRGRPECNIVNNFFFSVSPDQCYTAVNYVPVSEIKFLFGL